MKYIVDIKNETPNESINQWISENNIRIVHNFNHFEKMYIVEADNPISEEDFIERLVIDDLTTAIKLHAASDLITIDTFNDDDWWKSVVIRHVLEQDTETVNVVRRGKGYNVYLMDSGVNDTHEDFANTTIRHLFSHTSTPTDINGHGTSLASIIAGTKAGITSAEIVSVKIFEQGVPTLVSDIMKGLDAIALDYIDTSLGKPAVINMSWTINRNEFVEDKIRSLTNLGLIPIVAAGNSGVPIQNVTPAAMAEVGTIGSIGPNLQPSDFSDYTGTSDISFTADKTNYSPGLDYWAPGEFILSASKDGGYAHIAGTSAAAAVVSAVFIYQFSRLGLEYGKVYHSPDMGFGDIINEVDQIATIESLNSSLLTPYRENPFILTSAIVDLSEQYKNCTNRVLVTEGVYDDNFEIDSGWAALDIIVKKGVPNNRIIYDPSQVDSASIEWLPEGLILDEKTGMLTGTMNEEVGEEKYKVFDARLILVRGEKTIDHKFQVIYVDPEVITEEFTVEDYGELVYDSGMILQFGICTRCPTLTPLSFTCPGAAVCIDCDPCAAPGKGVEQLCRTGGCP